MSDRVQFDEKPPVSKARRKKNGKRHSFIARSILKLPGVRTETRANLVMLGIAVVAVAASYAVLTNTFGESTQEELYIEDIPAEEREQIPDDLLESLPSRNE